MKASLLASAVASALAASTTAWAQQATAEQRKAGDKPVKVEQISVTASPLDRPATELAQPATVLDEEALRRKRAASIGDTLANEPGVQSSAFGAGSARPIIRGLDGPRIRVLENGLGTLDASSVSPDHAVTTETLHAQQIEILRGPASLLYGSGAIGGIVNVVTDLIPREPRTALGGHAEARAGSANRERTLGAALNGGAGAFAWHLDAFRRKTRDYEIPREAVDQLNALRAGGHDDHLAKHVDHDEHEEPAPITNGRLPDSSVDSRGGGIGASWVGARGHLGAGATRLETVYGVPTGEGVRIDMRQRRTEASGEHRDAAAAITRARFRMAQTDYRHFEVEGSGEVATTFLSKASEARVELAHAPWRGITGTFGVQLQDQRLSALGEEAVIPETRSRATGVFVVEQKDLGAWVVDAGVRFERATRRPQGGDAFRFPTAVPRDFDLVSPAIGLVHKLPGGHRVSLSATQAQRAPATEELYSRGAHHATATFDIGDPALRREVSRNVDLTFSRIEGEARWRVNLFSNRLRDYVFGARVDEDVDGEADRVNASGGRDPDGEFLVQRYAQARARFHGVEAELAWRPGHQRWGARVFGDLVRARLAGGENLPRIAPARVGVELDGRAGDFTGSVRAIRAFAQNRTAPLEEATPGYTRVDAEIAWRTSLDMTSFTVFLQGQNLLDEVIRIHSSYLKELAPQMGRSFALGVRLEF